MAGTVSSRRFWTLASVLMLVLSAVTVPGGGGSVQIEQKGYSAPPGPQLDGEPRSVAHARLTAERPGGVAERPVTIAVSADERAGLGVSEPGTKKLRVGTVKGLNASIRFDDLSPADLRGRRARQHGMLQGTDDGGLVWTASVRSEGAAALQFRIYGFFLPPRAELWVYNAAGETHGPYTWAGPHGTREFWTHSVSGSEAFVQLRMRGPVSQGDLRRLGFVIADVAHVDDASLRRGGPGAAAAAGFCSYNASCVESGECAGTEWNNARNAVAHIRFVSGGFVYICSGGLVASSGSPGPYFLTANHCISRSREASSMEAYFQYRSTTACSASPTGCNGPGSSPSTLGATIVSTNRTGDYTLLRLSEAPPSDSYFLGWSTSAVANTSNTLLYRLSHPAGAPQAYSTHQVDTSKVTCNSWPRGNWIYSRDTFGATEGGSSGSPVLNSSAQIVGQLSGGCGFNVNDNCDRESNATVDGAFASYYPAVAPYLGPASSNQPPTAAFTYSCDELVCNFDGRSSVDGDGIITSYAWNFGDSSTGSEARTVHTFAPGTYTVTLQVTDDDGASGTTSQSITVGQAPTGITLTARGYKVRGLQKADLAWSGTTAAVDIFRDDVEIGTASGSSYTDNINQKGGGSYVYKVCETNTSVCSAPVTVAF
jgi:V8-like Glu-specific endopeptidase